jgi:hypothetical protein
MNKSRQKELTRTYKMAMPPTGIFTIKNIATGKTLLEGSRNLTGAMNRHRFELRQGVHRNRALQADWQCYGEAGFAFEIVERIEQKAEADFDYAAELTVLSDLWREKRPLGAENSYL